MIEGLEAATLLAAGRAVDPYALWAQASGSAALVGRAGSTVPLLLELEPAGGQAPRWPDALDATWVTQGYSPAHRFVTAEVPAAQLAAVVADPRVLRWQIAAPRSAQLAAERRSPAAPAAWPAQAAAAPATGAGTGIASPPTWGKTLIGIIDDGCPWAHPNLADGEGRTRVRSLWQMDAAAHGSAPYGRVGGAPYGRVINGATLDAALAAAGPLGAYAVFGDAAVLGRARLHGNGVTQVAAGNDVPWDLRRYAGAGPDLVHRLPVAFVQLPVATVADTTGGSIARRVLDALHHLEGRREDLKAKRLVVNLSFGSLGGPHDGSSLAERALLDFLDTHPQVTLLVPAGNANREPVHQVLTLAAQGEHTFDWWIGPEHGLESYLELWWPVGADLTGVEVSLWAPGATRPTVQAGCGAMQHAGSCGLVFAPQVAQREHGAMCLLAVRATRGAGAAPHGRWRVRMTQQGRTALEVSMWTERNDTVLGPRRRQQSRLSLPPAPHAPSGRHVLPSLSGIAPSALTASAAPRYLVIGAARLHDGARSVDSGTGPPAGATAAGRLGSDGLATAELGAFLRGLLVPKAQAGCWTRAAGTSLATALATRQLANDFERLNVKSPGSARGVGLRMRPAPTADGWFEIGRKP